MRFAEEFLLLLRAEDGTLSRAAEWLVRSALGAAVLMDLALENRIDTDADGLFLTDSTPVGDPLLDPMLAEIAGTEDTHTPSTGWIMPPGMPTKFAKPLWSG